MNEPHDSHEQAHRGELGPISKLIAYVLFLFLIVAYLTQQVIFWWSRGID